MLTAPTTLSALRDDLDLPYAGGPAASPEEDARVRRRLLVADDDAAIRTALARVLGARGYEVHLAESGTAALQLLRRVRFATMLCDVRMPGLSGPETLREALALDGDLAVLMFSGVNDAPTAADALCVGAMDYLVKPVDPTALERSLERALERRDREIETRRVEALVREEVTLRTAELEKEQLALRSMTVAIAETLINAMEVKNVYLRGHSQRVAELAASIAEQLGLDADTVEHVRLAGRLHDVGQIGIREAVLNKPGTLTPEEFEHVREHVHIGLEILAPLKHLGVVLTYVRDHHEHWGGGGYPRGVAGEQISIGGRILAAADAFDALTSRRAYREAMTPEQVVEYLGATQVGRLLDPDVYQAMRAVVLGSKSLVLTFLDDLHA
jgi:putative two-component system response regulator